MKTACRSVCIFLILLLILSMPLTMNQVTASNQVLISNSIHNDAPVLTSSNQQTRGIPVHAENVVIGKKASVESDIIPYALRPRPAATGTIGVRCTGTRYAIIYGINNYPGSENDLRGCIHDANLVQSVLTSSYGFESTNIIKWSDTSVRRKNIILDIADIKSRISNGGNPPADELVFFFSGHGASGQAADNDNNFQDQSIVIWNDAGNDFDFLWDGELVELFKDFPTSRVIFVFDSCFSGGMSVLKDTGRIVTTACGSAQLSSETLVSGMYYGAFTYSFFSKGIASKLADVKPLRTSGRYIPLVTIEEAYDYTKAALLKARYTQVPVIADLFTNDLLP